MTSSSSASCTWTWDPSSFLVGGGSSAEQEQYAVVLLNQAVPPEQVELFSRVWEGATIRLCADGGANRLLCLLNADVRLSSPNAIVGDLDSLSSEARAYFERQGVTICHKPSQYATDLQKCVQWIEDWEDASRQEDCSSQAQLTLVIIGGLSGRLDQTAHTLHCLWKLCPPLQSEGGYEDPEDVQDTRGGTLRKRTRTWVISDACMAILLPSGTHTLFHPCPPLGVACGILPFGVASTEPARVRTEGLEWDLDPNQPQSLGGYLSTSNHVLYPRGEGTSAKVVVHTDRPIYWSIEVGRGA